MEFIHPTGLPPARNLAALMSEIIPAMMGVETEVPPPPKNSPPMTKTNMLPARARSGYPLPLRIYPGYGCCAVPFTLDK